MNEFILIVAEFELASRVGSMEEALVVVYIFIA
jgi:hypothetical protein